MSTACSPGKTAALAALLECSVDKPGNVGPSRDFQDTRLSDFFVSALILGEECDKVASGKKGFGQGVYDFVSESLNAISVNAHLGTSILFMPVAMSTRDSALPMDLDALKNRLEWVLEDAGWMESYMVCKAIRAMSPGGLSDPSFYEPSVGELLDDIGANRTSYLCWMSLGREFDGVARETVEGYPMVFRGAEKLMSEDRVRDGVLELYIDILADNPDTLVLGKNGEAVARMVSDMARKALRCSCQEAFVEYVGELDTYCAEHSANPGTTADIVGAAIYVALLAGGRP